MSTTRQLGYFSISQNYEVGFTGPFDARLATPLKSELPTMSRAYPGMIVSVFGDTASNNGVYFLDIPSPIGNPSLNDWKKLTVGGAGITSLTTDTPDYLSFDFATDPSIPKLTIKGTTAETANRLVARDTAGRAFAVDPAVGSNDQTLATTAWVNTQLSSTFSFKGGFNANTGAIDGGGVLYPNTDPARVAVSVGDTYVVTTSGDFFGNASTPLTIGDSVVCKTDAVVGASQETNFIVIQSDTDLATANTVGLGNVKPEDPNVSGEDPGVSVRYSNGTAFIQNTSANNPYYQYFFTPDSFETVQPAGPGSTLIIKGAGGTQVYGDNDGQSITIDTNPGGNLVTSGANGTANYMPIFTGQSSISNSTLIYNPNTSRFITLDGFQPGNLYLSPSDPGSQGNVSIYDKNGENGNNGQVLTSDGSGVFWGDVASGNAYTLAAQQVQPPDDESNVLLTLNTNGEIDSQVTLIAGSNITLTRGNSAQSEVTIASTASGGSMNSWSITSNTGEAQAVSNGQVVDIDAGDGLTGLITDNREVKLAVDYSNIGIINDATDATQDTLDNSDLFMFQDFSASASTAVKKATLLQLKTYIGSGNIPYVNAVNNFLVGHTVTPSGTAEFNTSLGKTALESLTNGDKNSTLGYNAGQKINIGNSNVAVGYNALGSLVSGDFNIAIGDGASLNADLGGDLITIGRSAGFSTGRSKNSFKSVYIGNLSGQVVTTGTGNTYIGHNSGSQTTTSGGNTIIGSEAEISSSTSSGKEIVIGAGAVGHAKEIAVIGDTSIQGIHPGNPTTCDLGSPDFKFKDSYVGTLHSSISFDPPETNTSSGTPGDIVFGTPNLGDLSPNWYIYVCVQPDIWRRVELNENTWSQSNPGQTSRFVVRPCDTTSLTFEMSRTEVFDGSTTTTIQQDQYSVGDFIVYKDDVNGALKNGEIINTTLSNRVSLNRIDISQTYPTNQDVSCA